MMNLKSFLYIVALLIITAVLFYVVCPKYNFHHIGIISVRHNRITGTSILQRPNRKAYDRTLTEEKQKLDWGSLELPEVKSEKE